jgi:UDP-glucuronate decarboxylase
MEYVVKEDIEEIAANGAEFLEKLLGKEVLITGAAGFLGRYFMAVFNHLNSKNPDNPITVVALDNYITTPNSETSGRFESSKHVEWIFGDAKIGSQLPNKFDYIIHAAGIASPEHYRANPLQTIDVAVNVTRELLEKAKNDGARMIFFSSSEIYGDPFPEFIPTSEDFRGNVSTRGPRACYDESKRMGETLCHVYETYFDVHVSVVRPFNVYGPGMMPKDFRVLPNFAASIARGEDLKVYGHGKQTRTFCYITDAMNGFFRALIGGPKPDIYNVGNPTPEISMSDLAKLVCATSKSETEFELVKYPSSYPEDEPNRRCPNISKISMSLGYKPAVTLEEGLKRFLEWASINYTSEYL